MDEIIPLLQGNFMTKKLPQDLIQRLAGAMQHQTYQAGDVIIRYGDEGTHYFIQSKGTTEAIIYNPGTPANDPELEKHVMFKKDLPQGCGFGELALIYNDKRSASIIAKEDAECWTLDGILFKKIIIQASMQKRNTHASFINSIELLSSLDKAQKLKLVDGL